MIGWLDISVWISRLAFRAQTELQQTENVCQVKIIFYSDDGTA